MAKVFGARIVCVVCGAQPWPDDPAIPERFDLMRFDANGWPSESPNPGEWRCGAHYPPRRPKFHKTAELGSAEGA